MKKLFYILIVSILIFPIQTYADPYAVGLNLPGALASFNETHTDWSLSFWHKTTETGLNVFAGNSGASTRYSSNTTSNSVTLRIASANISWSVPGSLLSNGEWKHFVIAVDREGTSTLYIDNTSYGDITTPNFDTDFDNFFGAGSARMKGTIDEIIFFDYKIDSAKVAELNSGYAYDGSAYAIWHLDEGTGSTLNDSSGNDLHLTITGTYSWVTGIVLEGEPPIEITESWLINSLWLAILLGSFIGLLLAFFYD